MIGTSLHSKTHLAIAIARAAIHNGACGRFFDILVLVNKLEAEIRAGRQGRMPATCSSVQDFVVPDELGHLPFAQSDG